MKRLILLFLTLIVMGSGLKASPIDSRMALRVAQNFCLMQGVDDMKLVNITSQLPFSEFYTFVGENGKGFVLVSADDCVIPVLGFSADGIFATNDMPDHVLDWLRDYEDQIRFYRDLSENGIHSSADEAENSVKAEWDRLLSDEPPTPPQYTSVDPLITTKWGQQSYYNTLCPYDSIAGIRSPAGCVAIAAAQVMKYWSHPATGHGFHSYNCSFYGPQSASFGTTSYAWSNMPDSLTSSSSTTEINAVATLIYHVGVAVDMLYGHGANSSSGAYSYNEGGQTINYGTTLTPSTENALRYYFKYRSNCHHIAYSDFTNADWIGIMQNELNNSRPIIYSGRDTASGHSFVCDGYNNAGQFHFNWGWRGYYDGYFAIGSINPVAGGTGGTGSRSYNLKNVAIVSIRPNDYFGDTTYVSATVNTSGIGYGTVTGGGNYTGTNSTLVTLNATAASGCRFAGWTDGYWYSPRTFYANGGTYNYRANFQPLSGDTLGYSNTRFLCNYGASGTTIWGIKIPAANLTAGHDLTRILLYLSKVGSYTLKVYKGSTSSPTLVHTQSFTATSTLVNNWCHLNLSSNVPIDGTQPIWIMLESSASYPAACSYNACNNDSRVWGSSFGTLSANFSFMIWGVFTNGSGSGTTYGDTVSYCDTAPYTTAMGMGTASPFDWAVKLPATMVRHRNYVSDVMLYVPSAGTYTLNIYRGSATTSVTKVATQTATFTSSAVGSWQTLHLATPVATNNTMPIWIAFHTDNIAYPAASCAYMGDSNSCLVSTDSCNSWISQNTLSGGLVNRSWMIRAILSDDASQSVIINGPTSVGVGIPATYMAAGPSSATYNWTLTGAAHTSSSGNVATATWVTPGTYNVVVTANLSGTLLRDTLPVTVFGCTVNSFPYTMGFEESEPLSCWNIIDNDGDSYSWGYATNYFSSNLAHGGSDCFASASNIIGVGALSSDNWLVSPQLQLTAGHQYTLTWYDAATDSANCHEQYSVYVSTTGNSVGNFTSIPLFTTTLAGTAYTQRSVDLSAYAGQNIYIAFRHNTTGQSWLILDDISVTQRSQSDIHYTITVQSNNPEMGTVSGSGTFLEGTVTTIAATPHSGYRFVQWNDGNTDAIRTITVTANATYTAYFETAAQQQFTITVLSADETMGSTMGSGTFPQGATAVIAAQAHDGYRFVRWNDGNTENPRTITVTADATYIANFEVVTQYYTLTVLSADETMGAVTGSGSYPEGGTAVIAAIPHEGHSFLRWNDSNTDNPRTVTVTADATYIANFTSTQGIGEVGEAMLITTLPGYRVLVSGSLNHTIEAYDMMGRRCAAIHSEEPQVTLQLPSAGVYLIVADGSKAQRVVLMK